MTNIFISHTFSGLCDEDLHTFINPIIYTFRKNNFCHNCHIILVTKLGFYKGMKIDLKCVYGKMQQLLIVEKGIYVLAFKSPTTHVIEYNNLNDLLHKLDHYVLTVDPLS